MINKIAARTVRRFRARVKEINRGGIENARASVASYMGHFKHSNSRGRAHQLRERLNIRIDADRSKVDKMFDDMEN